MIAIVNFRTQQNGAYKWMRGKRRGYWRVLVVQAETASGIYRWTDANVIATPLDTREGIDCVTSRSNYCIDDCREECDALAAALNTWLADNPGAKMGAINTQAARLLAEIRA